MPKKQKKQKAKKSASGGGWLQFNQPSETAWRWLWPLLATAFILRAWVAVFSDYTLHPDEIMQYMEPAHRLAFGNGVVHWEYLYGARSWLLPGFIAAVLKFCAFVGLDSPSYYVNVVKVIFCAVATIIPWGMYVVARNLFSETAARLALIGGVFWYELIAFAHKPMTEFVATALLLLVMAHTFRKDSLSITRACIVAALSVLAVAVRFQYAPALAVVGLVALFNSKNKTATLAAGVLSVLAVGLFDYFTWGGFLHSYIVNARANLYFGGARDGESSPFIFLQWLFIGGGGLFFVAVGGSLTNLKKYALLLLLVAAVLLPHIFQEHREYRFIFAVIPLWIILFAAALSGLSAKKLPIKIIGVGYFFLLSLLGIGNHIPAQSFVYRAFSAELELHSFFNNPARPFALYQKLADDESLKGLWDSTVIFSNTGGYYYLHRPVPFYDHSSWRGNFFANDAGDYVSHIISSPPTVVQDIRICEGGRVCLQIADGSFLSTPVLINDKESGRLILWNEKGEAATIKNFSVVAAEESLVLWKSDSDNAVREWADYLPNPDGGGMYPHLKKALGDDIRKPPANGGVRYK